MKVLNVGVIDAFADTHAEASSRACAWLSEMRDGTWKNPNELRSDFPTVSILRNHTFIFNVGGNRYRIETRIAFKTQTVLVEWAGTHSPYDKRKY